MLYIGEKVGCGGPEMDIAVDPLEGTSLTAKNAPNALTVVALAEKGNFLHAPDIYMDKIAVGPDLPEGVVSLDASIEENLKNLARAKKCEISDLMVCTLDRDRHEEMIARIREAGARMMLISDGDVAGVIAACLPISSVDIYVGSGGAPEGVLAAAAMRCTGGQMEGRLMFENEEQVERARAMGQEDPRRLLQLEDMAKGDVLFSATGVTTGPLLRGIKRSPNHARTHSLVMRSKSGTLRFVEGWHNFKTKTWATDII